jgi:hypothetical protein
VTVRVALPHERDLDIRHHLMTRHPLTDGSRRPVGAVKLSTYLRHRELHRLAEWDHTHNETREQVSP